MDHSILNRNHPNHHYQQQVIKTELVHHTIQCIKDLLVQYPSEFDVTFLHSLDKPSLPVHEAIADLYNKTVRLYQSNSIAFDDHWHWNIAWRQALSFESLLGLAHGDRTLLIQSFHPKCHSVLTAIFNHDLARYMRYYPWRWFSDLVFVGAGGFSSVYASNIALLFDVPEPGRTFGTYKRGVAIKVVDEKILNEITVQSRAFLALLFHGMTVCESTGDLLMIGTLAEGGNLESFIDRPIKNTLNLISVADMVTRLAFNLASLHDDIGMCHRNIHPQNVLCVDDDFLLVDYRFSTASNEATEVTKQSKVHYGRLPYIAPELRQGVYTEKSDVFSLGVIMWQLISQITFPSPEVLLDAPEIYRIEWLPGVPTWYLELTMACLEPRPENRPDAEEIGLLARKFAAAGPRPQSDDQDWIAYVKRRREACKQHQLDYKRRSHSADSSSTINGLTTSVNAGQELYMTSATATAFAADDDDDGAGASRLYTLRNLPSTEPLFNLPFHRRLFDPVNISPDHF
ncbi:kinase-like domain-containing protein [Absidia repens]|uniref:Kinase-like domain-containing protein n=1 Tax=Absidia repens TaxID=90262 RepID=A0A1X2IVT6_9FUNG|nr:kinase-like domain-containing protein [Absidia repens]